MTLQELENLILFRDACLIVLNRPSGIAVHAGNGRNDALDQYFDLLKFGLPQSPQLAHRLDKDTSGCLVLGRHRQALARLMHLLQTNQIKKTYLAQVQGLVVDDQGSIDLPLAPQSPHKHRWWMEVNHKTGKPSLTHFRVLSKTDHTTFLELSPITGRTHQLRIHCAAISHPIIGDKIYGSLLQPSPLLLADCMHLHAWRIQIPYHAKKEPLNLEAPLPLWAQGLVERGL